MSAPGHSGYVLGGQPLPSDSDCAGGRCPSPRCLRVSGTGSPVIVLSQTREAADRTFPLSSPGERQCDGVRRCSQPLLPATHSWAPHGRRGWAASTRRRAPAMRQRGSWAPSPGRARPAPPRLVGTLGRRVWGGPSESLSGRTPAPSPLTSSLVRSTSLGSFTRIRFVTMRAS